MASQKVAITNRKDLPFCTPCMRPLLFAASRCRRGEGERGVGGEEGRREGWSVSARLCIGLSQVTWMPELSHAHSPMSHANAARTVPWAVFRIGSLSNLLRSAGCAPVASGSSGSALRRGEGRRATAHGTRVRCRHGARGARRTPPRCGRAGSRCVQQACPACAAKSRGRGIGEMAAADTEASSG